MENFTKSSEREDMSDFKLDSKDQPVYPTEFQYMSSIQALRTKRMYGVTKLELFSLEILKSLIPKITENIGNNNLDDKAVTRSIELANKLLKELDNVGQS